MKNIIFFLIFLFGCASIAPQKLNPSVYYKNEKVLYEKIILENAWAKQFIDKHDLNLNVVRKKYWKDFWNISSKNEELETYMDSIGTRPLENGKKIINYDVLISDYNFNN